jgi:DNA-binding winged helix-turn-helix (wHTH) protein/tetratricopeptide (TPR) repeat protein
MKRTSSAFPELSARRSKAMGPDRGVGETALCFGGLRLEADGTLLRGEEVVHVPPKELAALKLLLANAGQIVSPLQLKRALWADVHVTADSVPKCLSSLRALLEPEDCIQTVYKRGYRFTGEVRDCGAATVRTLPRLAILPFATGYAVPEHLGPAVAEETIARLTNAHNSSVAVVARDSVFTLAQRGLTAQQIGATLKADLALTGTLLALPGYYRLRAEMILVEQNTQIWVEDIMVPEDRTVGLESELVSRLVSRMGIAAVRGDAPSLKGTPASTSLPRLSSEGVSIAAAEDKTGPQQREAYEIFQRARYEWQTLERHRMQDGLQHLTRAAELDPSLISAKIDLAHLCVTQAFYGFMAPMVAAELIRRTAESIPDLPRQAVSILPALGWISFYAERNLSAALWAFSQSAHLVHDPWTTRVRAMFALSRHRFDEAIGMLTEALRADPWSPWLHNRLAWAFHLDRQADKSIKQIEDGITRFPEHEGTSLYGAIILAYNGETGRAVQLAETLALRLPYFDLATSVHAYALARGGRKDEARTILERLQWLSRERFVMKSFNPAVYLALGDPESALGELRAAGEDRCPWFFQMLADPRLELLHGRPEFTEMKATLARMEASVAQEADQTGSPVAEFLDRKSFY